ncbi:phospho-N-acetylmuramoyl-pentapeptide-transferase homolog [Primulina eburnea]|uniref:phospho-N-acetylmuramoyl-pentapeptide- transferase homolog n=1 Tax=Primulina eburnea TaxID=1245227 RepID=UPI003C6C8383
MQSLNSCATNGRNLSNLRFTRSGFLSSRVSYIFSFCQRFNRCYCFDAESFELRVRTHGSPARHRVLQVFAMDEDSMGISSFDWGDSDMPVESLFSSSDSDNSDGEIILQPITDVDLPTSKERLLPADDAIAVTAHRLGMLSRARKKRKTVHGILNNVGLIVFLMFLLFIVDQWAWRVVRLPLESFYLMRPFVISAVLVSCVGYICVPLFRLLKLQSIIKKESPKQHPSKKGTPTMGGLYFVPIGLLVAEVLLGFSSIEVSGAVVATIAFATIGLLDDFLSLKNNHIRLSGLTRICLEAAVGVWFSYWLCATDISTPYSMKMVVPLPAPVGLVCLEKKYTSLTLFCFVSMANGINVTNRLDGLSAGAAALAFVGMSIVVLPICSDLAIFGASMAGACVGFLMHNRYKASIFMGDTGALALGGALAAMASCTGMFFPLFISSGVFVLEAASVVAQVCFFKVTRFFGQTGRRLFHMAPFHRHLELSGVEEPMIVSAAYVVTCVLILCAAYVGITSA